MAFSTKSGSFNIGTGAATTTVAVTGVGFQPTAIVFWWNGDTSSTDTVGGGDHRRGMGFVTSTSDRRSVTTVSEDAQASADTSVGQQIDECIYIFTLTGSTDGLADLSSMDADGFTLVIDNQFSADYRIHYMALGGADLTNAATGIFTRATSTGNQSITGVGYQPDCLLLMSASIWSDSDSAAVDSRISIGFAVSSSQRGTYIGGSNNGATTMQTVSYCYSGECIAIPNTTLTGIDARADFVSMDADGFTIDWLEAPFGLERIHYLALKGGDYFVGNLLTRTDGNDITESSFGFAPSGALFLSHCKTESTQDTFQDHDEWSMGACSAIDERASAGVLDEDGTANSEVAKGVEHDAVYMNIATDDTLEGVMDIKSLDADGFTCVMDDTDPSAAFVTYLAFGPAVVVGGTGVKNPILMGRNPLIGPIG